MSSKKHKLDEVEEHKDKVKPVPDGYHTMTPYFVCKDGAKYIEFLKNAFGAVVTRSLSHDGRIQHAEVKFGTSMLMVGEHPGSLTQSSNSIYVYVDDVDAVYKQAVAAGAKGTMEPADMFYGDRHGALTDTEGNQWWVATHIEDMTETELAKRSGEFHKKQKTKSDKESKDGKEHHDAKKVDS